VEPINNTIIFPLHLLSNEQLKAHDLVLNSLKDGNTIRMIICGGAGTGKSTLVKAMVQSITEYSKTTKAVHIMALTGVTTFNIGGATIHHELAIHAERRPNEPYMPITGDQCQRMQDDFKDTIIIIDEYSMVGRAMLATVTFGVGIYLQKMSILGMSLLYWWVTCANYLLYLTVHYMLKVEI